MSYQELVTKSDLEAAVLKLESKIAGLDGRITLVHWMLGFVLALQGTMLFKVFA